MHPSRALHAELGDSAHVGQPLYHNLARKPVLSRGVMLMFRHE